jgi:hypothetical protein
MALLSSYAAAWLLRFSVAGRALLYRKFEIKESSRSNVFGSDAI